MTGSSECTKLTCAPVWGDSAALVGFPQDVAKHALSALCKTVVIRARSSVPLYALFTQLLIYPVFRDTENIPRRALRPGLGDSWGRRVSFTSFGGISGGGTTGYIGVYTTRANSFYRANIGPTIHKFRPYSQSYPHSTRETTPGRRWRR
jgi:hypothetical protein